MARDKIRSLIGAATRCFVALLLTLVGLKLTTSEEATVAAASFLGKISFFYGLVLGFISTSIIPKLNELRTIDGLADGEVHAVSKKAGSVTRGLWGLFILSVFSALLGIAAGEFKSFLLVGVGMFLFVYVTTCFVALPAWINEIEDFKVAVKQRAAKALATEKRLSSLADR